MANERAKHGGAQASQMLREYMANEPLLLKVPEAAAMLGVGRSTIYKLAAADALPMVRINRSVRIPTRAIREYAERLEAEQGEA